MCHGAFAGLALLAACAGTSQSLRLLNSGGEQQRLRAISEIAGSDAVTTDVLIALSQALEDPSPTVRWASAGALNRLGPRAAEVLPALLGCARRQPDPLALRCAQAAAAVGPGALSGLRELLVSSDPATRHRGALAMAGLGTVAAPAVDGLISLLGDDDMEVSAAAIDALTAIGPAALLPLITRAGSQSPIFGPRTSLQIAARTAIDAMKPYSERVLLDMLTRGGLATYWAVEKIRAQGMEAEAVPTLVGFLNSGSRNLANYGAQVLGSFGAKAAPAVPFLAASLRVSSVDDGGAAGALAGIGEASLPVVEEFLRAPDEISRIKGTRILSEMRPLPHKRLLKLAHGDDKRLREKALEILERADALDLPALLDLSRDPDRVIRRSAVRGLGRIPPGNERAGEALARLMLQDPDESTRAEAAQAFSGLRGAAAPAAPALIQALGDPSEEVRRLAVAALAQIGERVFPALLEIFRNGSATVRASALGVFKNLRREGRVTDSVERELRIGLAKDDAALRVGATLALLVVGRSRSEEVAFAAEALRSGDPVLVRMAIFALREAGVAASAALPALLGMVPVADRNLGIEHLETLTSVGRRDPRLIPVFLDALRRGEGGRQAREGLSWFDDDAIAPLLVLLKERDVKDRAELEKALTDRGAATIPGLEAALADGDAAASRSAATLLCRLERVPPLAVPVFLQLLQQEDQSAWPHALRCLRNAGASIAPHAAFLAQHYVRMNEAGKIGVVDALGFCGEAARPFVPLLVTAVQDPASLEDHGRASPPKRSWRSSSPRELRLHAIRALGRLGDIAAASVPVVARYVVEQGRDYEMQRVAIEALGMIGPAARETVPTLVTLLDSSGGAIQKATLSALIAMAAPPEILVPKCLAFLRDEKGPLRQPALTYLVNAGYDNEDFRVLLAKLVHNDRLGLEATRALRHLRPPSGGFVLIAPDLPRFELTQWGVRIGWGQGVPGATGYRLFRREEPDGEWALLEESGAARFDDHSVEPGKVYAYRVEAFNADADGRPSEVQTVAITGTQIREQHAPPTGLTVETALVQSADGEHRVARLKWEAPRGWDCRGYVIFRGLTGSNVFAPIGVSRSTSFVDEKTEKTALGYSVSYFTRGIDADFRQSEASQKAVTAAVPFAR
jgi:HEAT repeat protein